MLQLALRHFTKKALTAGVTLRTNNKVNKQVSFYLSRKAQRKHNSPAKDKSSIQCAPVSRANKQTNKKKGSIIVRESNRGCFYKVHHHQHNHSPVRSLYWCLCVRKESKNHDKKDSNKTMPHGCWVRAQNTKTPSAAAEPPLSRMSEMLRNRNANADARSIRALFFLFLFSSTHAHDRCLPSCTD